MAKFVLMAVLCIVACAQLSTAASIAEVIDNDLRANLNSYYKILTEVDAAHKANMEKLIAQTETALKETDHKEKIKILDSLNGAFPEDFNLYLNKKLQELHIDADIERSLSFYKAILESNGKGENDEFKQDFEKAIETLNTLLKETDAAKKVESFAQFSKDFSASFKEFIAKATLPDLTSSLTGAIAFFDGLLGQADIKFKDEITALKKHAEEGLAAATLEEKQKIYYEITNPENKDLFNYLKEKYIEQKQ